MIHLHLYICALQMDILKNYKDANKSTFILDNSFLKVKTKQSTDKLIKLCKIQLRKNSIDFLDQIVFN